MTTLTTILAQAAPPPETGGGWGTFIGIVVIIWIIAAIHNAITKPKEYDISLNGKARERR